VLKHFLYWRHPVGLNEDQDEADGRLPIAEVLPGMAIHPLEDGWTPLEAFVLVKSLDEHGQSSWSYRTTHRPNREELLGALIVQTDLIRSELGAQWDNEEG
jgi:hypothetical protein